VALPTLAQRQAANPLMPGGALSPNVPDGEDLLPGQTNVTAPDGPNPTPNAEYWARVTRGFDFSDADRMDGGLFNRVLWKG
jgi:hypothetical protein